MQIHYLSIFTNSKIAGLALWQLADIPIDRAVSNDEHRPRGLNNKGGTGFQSHPCTINFPFNKYQQVSLFFVNLKDLGIKGKTDQVPLFGGLPQKF